MSLALGNSATRYGAVSKTLHWVIAALVLVQFVLAELAQTAGEGRARNPLAALEQLALLARHKSIGITILALVVLRAVWRLAHDVPPLPAAMTGWQRVAARVNHGLFYALLLALPLTGWMTSSAANFPVSWFGFFTLPDLVGANEALEERLEQVHGVLAWTLAVLVLVHVAAALKHHFWDEDDVLIRMLPWAR